MLNRFTEMINKGVAPANYKNDTFNDNLSTKNDGFCRLYNNVWGMISDTCMTLHKEGNYVITGSLIKQKDKFREFVNAENWCTCVFKQATKFKTLKDYFDSFNLQWAFSIQNGDDIVTIFHKNIQ